MSYAGALWLAVQEDLYRAECSAQTPEPVSRSSSVCRGTEKLSHESPPTPTPPPTPSCLDLYDDHFLSQCFHFTRQCLIFIVDCVKARMRKDVFRPSSDAASDEAMTLAALYYYAHGFLPKKITDAVGLEHANATDAVNTVSKVLEDMSSDFITFPGTYDDRMGVAQGFKRISGIPNVVGLLGWLHVKVNPTPTEERLFLNTRCYHSVMMQIISDVDGNLLSVKHCCPGGSHEQVVWESSDIYQEFNRLQHGQTWILGGKGLCNSKHVLSPVESSRIKKDAVRRFNKAHFRVWKSTEHILGSLKTRFKCLHNCGTVTSDNLKPVARIITACCVLHNISKKFSVPLPSKLVLEHLHPDPEIRIKKQETFGDIDEATEDMIEMCFGISEDEE